MFQAAVMLAKDYRRSGSSPEQATVISGLLMQIEGDPVSRVKGPHWLAFPAVSERAGQRPTASAWAAFCRSLRWSGHHPWMGVINMAHGEPIMIGAHTRPGWRVSSPIAAGVLLDWYLLAVRRLSLAAGPGGRDHGAHGDPFSLWSPTETLPGASSAWSLDAKRARFYAQNGR
jgi:hypothetical protein